MADFVQVWVLLRRFEARDTDHEPPETRVLGVYASYVQVEARMEAIAKANPQYPLVAAGTGNRWRPGFKGAHFTHRWRIGPEEDEGFFGHRAVELWAVQVAGVGLIHDG